jgi:ParB family chromosome partitioning protein
MSKPALGRGLGALLGAPSPSGRPVPPHVPATAPPPPGSEPGTAPEQVALSRIRPCGFQPRKDFTAESLRELADSIREQGILQPLVVRPAGDGFELIAGERRWRAAQLAGLTQVPVVIRQADDRTVLELALIENLQRENLNPIEEAQGYAQLLDQFQLSQEQAAARVGKSRAAVANAVRLLNLPADVQTHVREGRLSAGHAKVLLGLTGQERQASAAQRVVQDRLSVRQTEELVARWQRPADPAQGGATAAPGATAETRDPHVARLEDRLRERLGTKVHLRYRGGKGAIEIRFFDDDDLERVLSLLGIAPE